MSSTITALTSGGGLAMAGDTSGQLELKTNNGTTAVTVDTSQNVGIGVTANSSNKLQVAGDIATSWATDKFIGMKFDTGTSYKMGLMLKDSSRECKVWSQSVDSDDKITFYTGSTPSERMRITSAGDVVMGGGTSWDYSVAGFGVSGSGSYTYATRSGGYAFLVNRKTSTGAMQSFTYNGSGVGDISTNGSNCTFNSTSDYRLKQNIQPMTGALAKVDLLKPVTYNWIRENQAGEGFIAHELQEVVPEAVTGTKDAVDEEGNPVYQAIDQSVLVATLTAAIQELNAKVDAQAAEIQALKGVA